MSLSPLRDQPWAITESGLQLVLAVASRGEVHPEVLDRARADFGDGAMDNSRPTLQMRDGSALIPVRGPLFRHAGLMTALSGATSYDAIGRCLNAALADGQVQRIVLVIDSPGGEVSGVAELAARIRAAGQRKPVVAYAEGTCASAAYWLASAAKEIVVASTAELGSIGVRAAIVDTTKAQEQAGVRRVEIVSSQSPGKRGSPVDDEVVARIQRRVDDLAAIFVADVARYRGVAVDKALADFGQGDVMIGNKAVSAGLADRLGSLDDVFAVTKAQERKKMSESKDLSARLAALRDTDPDLAAHIDRIKAEGEAQKVARIQAEAVAEAVRYEELIREGKAQNKICGPAHEATVRTSYPSTKDLSTFLAVAQAMPARTPLVPGAGVGVTDHDKRFAKTLARAGVVADAEAVARAREGVR